MAKERSDFTRETLYEQLWTEPIMRVARGRGISVRELKRVCNRYQIPVPPAGWWANKQRGYPVQRIPLPPTGNAAAGIVVEVGDNESRSTGSHYLNREQDIEWRITVPETLELTNTLVKKAAAAVPKVSREMAKHRVVRWQDRYRAKLVKPGSGNLDIAVSQSSLSRALRIMQALLAAFERRGFAVRVTEHNETLVTVLDENFQIALVERLQQVTVARSHGGRVELEPSARLMLRIGSRDRYAGLSDTTSRRLEDSLNRFVANLIRRALDGKRERARHAERQQRWDVEDAKNRLAQQQRDSEGLRRRRLRKAAVRWAGHQRNVDFVNAVERRVRDGALSADEQENAERWLAWAVQRLKAADPISELLKDAWLSAPLRPASPMPSTWQ